MNDRALVLRDRRWSVRIDVQICECPSGKEQTERNGTESEMKTEFPLSSAGAGVGSGEKDGRGSGIEGAADERRPDSLPAPCWKEVKLQGLHLL